MARSASTFLEIRTSAFFNACINIEYDSPYSRTAAFILAIQSCLKSLFFCLRSLYEYCRALWTDSFAVLNSLLLPPTYPFAARNTFFLRRLEATGFNARGISPPHSKISLVSQLPFSLLESNCQIILVTLLKSAAETNVACLNFLLRFVVFFVKM